MTDTLFQRLDPTLARTVRDQAKARDLTIMSWRRRPSKLTLTTPRAPDHRAKLLQVTEAALLARAEEHLNRLLSNVSGRHAKEAVDTALTLELVKQILALGVRGERQLGAIINSARRTPTSASPSAPPGGAPSHP